MRKNEISKQPPWLGSEIDRRNTLQTKAEAQADGFARCIQLSGNQLKFVSALPDLAAGRASALSLQLKQFSAASQIDAEKFQQQTIGTSFAFSNDLGMNESIKALHAIPAVPFKEDKLRVGLIVGHGNFESMLPELMNHVHMVLFVDIDQLVLDHNLFSASILQGKEEFACSYLDETRNPLLANKVKVGPFSTYRDGESKPTARFEKFELTKADLAAFLSNNAAITFARYSMLSTKLQRYIKGHIEAADGGPLFEKNDLQQFSALGQLMAESADMSIMLPVFTALVKVLTKTVNKNKPIMSAQEAEHLRQIVDLLVDNRYFIKSGREQLCRAAARELTFASAKLSLFDVTQVQALKEILEAHDAVISYANVTNLLYYDNAQPFQPTARAKKPWAPEGRLLNSLKVLCDINKTIYFFSTYDKPGSQLLSSQCCQGLMNYAGAVSRNIKFLNQAMVGTAEVAKQRETRADPRVSIDEVRPENLRSDEPSKVDLI